MLTGRELALGVIGAWRIARGDRTAMLCFDRTPRGFWRSFWVAVILAPASVLMAALQLDALKVTQISLHVVLLEAGFVALNFLAMPALLSEFAARTGRVHQFMSYVVANNYAQILATGFWLATLVVAANIGGGASALVVYLAFGLLMLYQYRIARIAFELERLPAALVVLAEFGVSFLLQTIQDGLLQRFIAPA